MLELCDGWKFFINNKVAEINDKDINTFFERGIILLRNSKNILNKKLIKECKNKFFSELTESELKEINPEIIIPFGNGILVTKGISLSFDHRFYQIDESVDVFIYLDKKNIIFIGNQIPKKNSCFTNFYIKELISYQDTYGISKDIPLTYNIIEKIKFNDNTFIEIETFTNNEFINDFRKEFLKYSLNILK